MFAPVLQLPVIPAALFSQFKRERQAGKSEVSCFKLDLMQCQNIFLVYLTWIQLGWPGCLHETGVVQDIFGRLDYSCFHCRDSYSMAECSASEWAIPLSRRAPPSEE